MSSQAASAEPASLSVPLWCLATGVACVGFMVYLPLGALPAWSGFTENPWALTLLLAIAAAVSVRGAVHGRTCAPAVLRKTLAVGAFLAVMGNVNYLHYVYYYSYTVPAAQSAPQVGDRAPGFEVPDPDGGSWSLEAYGGTPVLLVFYRAHW